MDVRCVVAVVAGAPIMARCGHGAESAVMVPVTQGCCVFGVSHRGMTVACHGDMGLSRGVIIQGPDGVVCQANRWSLAHGSKQGTHQTWMGLS